MTLRHMKIFLAVYQTQHITKAAQQLRMTQPAVTRAIQANESYYGIRLFERINRKLYITQTGTMFYTCCPGCWCAFSSPIPICRSVPWCPTARPFSKLCWTTNWTLP